MKAGSVVDLVEAEEVVRQAVDLAERSAKCQVESVIVSMSAGRIAQRALIAEIELSGGAVTDGDIARVLAAGSRHRSATAASVLHSLPIGYSLDDAPGVRDPRGMLASRFGVDMHMVTADMAPVRNLMLAVERCHLADRGHGRRRPMWRASRRSPTTRPISAPPSSTWAPGPRRWRYFRTADSSMPTDLRSAATTSPLTSPAASTPALHDSERIKTIYGSVFAGGADERDMITVTASGR